MLPEKFNIRVYGLLIIDDAILVTDEVRLNTKMTKFPGGGLEFGEGLADALVREYKEELNVAVKVNELVYINDFLQISSFDVTHQLMCVYYNVELLSGKINAVEKPFDFKTNEPQCFRWVRIENLQQNDFTFPIDQKVVELLKV